MARRRQQTSRWVEIPDWVVVFDPDQWRDDEADAASDLAAYNHSDRVRAMMANARWSRARRDWADQHGVCREDLYQIRREQEARR